MILDELRESTKTATDKKLITLEEEIERAIKEAKSWASTGKNCCYYDLVNNDNEAKLLAYLKATGFKARRELNFYDKKRSLYFTW